MLLKSLSVFRKCSNSCSRFKSRQVNAPGYVVLNPVAIPPFLGIDLHPVKLHGEVNVIASCHSGHAALAHYLATLDCVAFVHVNMAHVPVDRLQSVSMIHDKAIAVDAERSRIDHTAVVGCFHAYVLSDREIVS